MSELQGVVSRAGSKEIKGRVYWSFSLEGVDGLFRTGNKDSGVNKGDSVSFSYEVDEWGNQVDLKSVKVLDSAPMTATVSEFTPAIPGKTVTKGTAVGRDEYWANKEAADVDRQKIISYQAATNIATNIVTAALAAEVLALPTKKADKFEAIIAMVTEVADELVVRYTTAPERVDRLVAGEEEVVKEDKNYGEDINDE